MKKLSVIIPVYNEESTVESIIDKVQSAPLPPGFSREIIIIDDASRDATVEKLESLRQSVKFTFIRHEVNAGKGAAVKTGLAALTGDYAIIQDADLEYNPSDYAGLLAPLVSGQADASFGSRYIGKKIRQVMSVNFIANKVLTAMSNLFTGFKLTDMETCYKVFSGETAKAIGSRMKARRFDMEPEITSIAADLGLSVVEVPIFYEPRTARQGKKIKWHDGFPAVWAIVKSGLPGFWRRRKWPLALVASLFLIGILFGVFKGGPDSIGDTPTYIQAIDIMNGAVPPANFIPNRLLTTFGGLEAIRALSHISGGIYPAWFVINTLLYFLGCIFLFKLLVKMFGSEPVAYLGAMFLAANYGFLLFGLNYLMDIGGWSFYIFSVYFLYKYVKSGQTRDILWSALMVGIGGLFKEYAFLGAVAIAVVLISQARRNLGGFIKKALQTAAIALIPTATLYVYVYNHFGYTYLDWLGFNSSYYVYHSRVTEYIKAFGSLMNVLAIAFVTGLVVLIKQWKSVGREVKVFLLGLLVSFLPIFFWPAITQRILTVTVPFVIIISAFWFKKYEARWYWLLPLLAVYILATFLMDSYILNAVSLPF